MKMTLPILAPRASPKNLRDLYQEQRGAVFVLFSIMLPMIMIFGIFIISRGEVYLEKSSQNFLARQIARDAIITFDQIITQEAEKNYQSICVPNEEGLLPSICNSQNKFNFITISEISNLSYSQHTKNAIKTSQEKFLTHLKTDQTPTINIEFPYEINHAKKYISIQVRLQKKKKLFFDGVLKNPDIHTEAKAKISIQ